MANKDTSAEDRLAAALEKILERSQAQGITGDQLAAILEKVGVKSAESMQRAIRPENDIHPGISAFSYPEGDVAKPKPIFQGADGQKRDVYLNFHRETEDMLTPAEIEAYNSIQQDYEAHGGSWKAQITDKGRRLNVLVPVAFMDSRMNLPPSLLLLLHELKTGNGVAEIHELLAEIARLKKLVGETDPLPGVVAKRAAPAPAVAGTVADLEQFVESQPYPTAV